MYTDFTSQQMLNDIKENVDWWRGAVIYQIYPRSFNDSNGDGIGDLRGITARLAYISGLGVDAIWICPFYASPMEDGGYDVSDYRAVHSMFGTLEDFDELIKQAHQFKIKVMIDLVLSHTSNQHEWFAQSQKKDKNKYSDWYVWADGKSLNSGDKRNANTTPEPPNNWLSLFGGSAWEWSQERGQYYLHNFWKSQPDLNFHNLALQTEILNIVEFWLKRGVDGFRIDTANYFFHDILLRDNPRVEHTLTRADGLPAGTEYAEQQHIYDKSQPENLIFLARLRSLMDCYKHRVLLAEIGDDHALERMAEYTRGNDRFHMAYSFHLLEENFDIDSVARLLTEIDLGLQLGWPCWSLSNHDVPRAVSRWFPDTNEEAKTKLNVVLLALLVSLRGSLCIYQGEELGLHEAEVPFELMQDSFGITHWPKFKGRDGCRTPIPWNGIAPGYGFSNAEKTWLPISEKHGLQNAVSQSKHTHSVLNTCKKLIKFRHENNAMRVGDFKVNKVNSGCLEIERQYMQQKITILLNFSEQEHILQNHTSLGGQIEEHMLPSTGKYLNGELQLPPYSATFIRNG